MVTWAISHRADRAAPAARPSATQRTVAPLRCAGARRTKTQEKDSEIPGIGWTIRRAGGDQPIQDIPSDGPLALAQPQRGANRLAQTRRSERSVAPFPPVQYAPAREATLDGVWGMASLAPEQPLRSEALGDVRGRPCRASLTR